MNHLHTPDWYKYKQDLNAWEEMYHPGVRKMLKNDMNNSGGDFDSTLLDVENLSAYKEHYLSKAFTDNISGKNIEEVVWNDLKEMNPSEYAVLFRGLNSGAKMYNDLLTSCAKRMLSGKDDTLIKVLKRIRTEAQQRIDKKSLEKQKKNAKRLGDVYGNHPLEPSPYHTWNKIFGSQKDFKKELINHARACNFLKDVEVKMKEIYEIQVGRVGEMISGRTDRATDVKGLMHMPQFTDNEKNSLSRVVGMTLNGQKHFNKDSGEST